MSAIAAEPLTTTGASPETPPLFVADEPKVLRDDRQENFRLILERFTMNDGTTYDAQSFVPHQTRYDTPVTKTTPWMTHLAGFNELEGMALAELGVASIHVSPEHLRSVEALRRYGHVFLEHDARAQHAILDFKAASIDQAPDEVINTGYSRGGMVGFGFNALARRFGRDVRYAEYIDPCLEHRLRLRDIEYAQLPHDAYNEGREIVGSLLEAKPGDAARAILGVPRRLAFWLQQGAVGQALFSGETGTFLPHLHPDTAAHVTFYTGNRYNHASSFEDKLAGYPNILVAKETGYHHTGARPRVRAASVGRVMLAQNLIQDHAGPAEIAAAIRQTTPTADLLSA